MTKLLEKAFEQARNLPDPEQDAIAAMILDELGDEVDWDRAFARSADVLAALAEEAKAEDRAGKTKPLQPDAL